MSKGHTVNPLMGEQLYGIRYHMEFCVQKWDEIGHVDGMFQPWFEGYQVISDTSNAVIVSKWMPFRNMCIANTRLQM